MKPLFKRTRYWILVSLAGLSAVPVFLGQSLTPVGANQSAMGLFDALQYAIENHPVIGVQRQQILRTQGLLDQQSGAFNTVWSGGIGQARTYTPLTRLQQGAADGGSALLANSNSLTMGSSRLFRNGVSVSPSVQISRVRDNFTNDDGLSTAHGAMTISFPLMRGRGRSVVAAGETAAAIEVRASALDLNQTIAEILNDSTSSYWRLVGAIKALRVAQDSETRGYSFLENTRTLIDAGQTPENEINNALANLAGRQANRIAAEQNVVAARQQLAVSMGLTASEMALLAQPIDDFPEGEGAELPPDGPAAMDAYIAEAMTRRADVLAMRQRIDESQVLLRAAENQLQPRLRLDLTLGYAGLRQGPSFGNYLGVPFQGIKGANVSGGLYFDYPPSNQTARGLVRTRQATVRGNELTLVEIRRIVAANVVRSVQDVRNSAARLTGARQSVEAYARALQGERDKFALGLNSFVDILTIEDRLTTALGNQVQAKLSYALSLVAFRFATGTLVEPDAATQTIAHDTFVTLPEFARGPGRP